MGASRAMRIGGSIESFTDCDCIQMIITERRFLFRVVLFYCAKWKTGLRASRYKYSRLLRFGKQIRTRCKDHSFAIPVRALVRGPQASEARLQPSTGQGVCFHRLRGHFQPHRRRLDLDSDSVLPILHRESLVVTEAAAAVVVGSILTVSLWLTPRAERAPVPAAHRSDARRTRVPDDTLDIRVHHGHPHRLGQRMAGREGQMIWKNITNHQCSKIPGLTYSPSQLHKLSLNATPDKPIQADKGGTTIKTLSNFSERQKSLNSPFLFSAPVVH